MLLFQIISVVVLATTVYSYIIQPGYNLDGSYNGIGDGGGRFPPGSLGNGPGGGFGNGPGGGFGNGPGGGFGNGPGGSFGNGPGGSFGNGPGGSFGNGPGGSFGNGPGGSFGNGPPGSFGPGNGFGPGGISGGFPIFPGGRPPVAAPTPPKGSVVIETKKDNGGLLGAMANVLGVDVAENGIVPLHLQVFGLNPTKKVQTKVDYGL